LIHFEILAIVWLVRALVHRGTDTGRPAVVVYPGNDPIRSHWVDAALHIAVRKRPEPPQGCDEPDDLKALAKSVLVLLRDRPPDCPAVGQCVNVRAT
jgi:hypothetical protein